MVENRQPLCKAAVTQLVLNRGNMSLVNMVTILQLYAIGQEIGRCNTQNAAIAIDSRAQVIGTQPVTILRQSHVETMVGIINLLMPAVEFGIIMVASVRIGKVFHLLGEVLG